MAKGLALTLENRLLMGRGRGGYYRKILSSNPIAYWPLWETSGTVAECLTDSNMNGTYARDVSTMGTGAGIADGRTAPMFDGTNDVVDIYSAALAAAFDPGNMTLIVWAKMNSAANWAETRTRVAMRIARDLNNSVQPSQTDSAAGQLACIVRDNSTFRNVDYPDGALGWMCLGLTRSVAANATIGYYDGVASDTNNASNWGGTAGTLDNTRTTIGSASSSAINNWQGYLAHAAVWDRALSAAEVAALSHV